MAKRKAESFKNDPEANLIGSIRSSIRTIPSSLALLLRIYSGSSKSLNTSIYPESKVPTQCQYLCQVKFREIFSPWRETKRFKIRGVRKLLSTKNVSSCDMVDFSDQSLLSTWREEWRTSTNSLYVCHHNSLVLLARMVLVQQYIYVHYRILYFDLNVRMKRN